MILLAMVAAVALCMPTASALHGTLYTYTIHVDFFAMSCSLEVAQVSLYDPSGNLVGHISSPYGAEVAIPITTSVPISSLTATAYGVATFDSYYSWTVSGATIVALGGAGNYWVTIRMD